MSESNFEENVYQIIRYLVEAGESAYSWGNVRQELGLTQDEFRSAYNLLSRYKCCYIAGIRGDEAQIFIDDGAYPFYIRLKAERIDLPKDAERLLKFLVRAQKIDGPGTSSDEVLGEFGWNKDRYLEAAQVLFDNEFAYGQAADDNPFWDLFVLPDGRNTVGANFRKPMSTSGATYMGNITTNISGGNNILNIGSVLSAASQIVQDTSSLNDTEKGNIKHLLERLNSLLQDMSEEHTEDAEAVAEMAKNLVDNAMREKPNKRLIEVTAEGLRKAATNISLITSQVLVTVNEIISFIDKIPK